MAVSQATVVAEYDDMYRAVHHPDYWEPEVSVVTMARLLRPGSHVLDVAGGAGRHSLYLAGQGHQLTTIDFSPVGAEKVTELARMIGRQDQIQALCRDIRDGLPEGPFDGIVFSLMFQYLTTVEASELMSWGMQHTTPGGLHALTCYLDDGLPIPAEFAGAFVPADPNDAMARYIAAGWTVESRESHYIGMQAPAFSAVVSRPGA